MFSDEYPIEIANLSASFKSGKSQVKVLRDISFRVDKGSIVGFLGPNGAGKTTTIHILLGFADATSGTARLFGQEVGRKISRQRIGYLPEHPDSYPFLKGRELLKMAGQLFGLSGNALKMRITEVLSMVDLQDAADRKIAMYSRGMMQRIGVAQALINDPDLVVFDEPTGGLDPIGRLAMRDIIMDLKSKGKTVFFSSHELSEVERICDNVIILSRGEIVTKGRVDDLIEEGQSLEQFFIHAISENGKELMS